MAAATPFTSLGGLAMLMFSPVPALPLLPVRGGVCTLSLLLACAGDGGGGGGRGALFRMDLGGVLVARSNDDLCLVSEPDGRFIDRAVAAAIVWIGELQGRVEGEGNDGGDDGRCEHEAKHTAGTPCPSCRQLCSTLAAACFRKRVLASTPRTSAWIVCAASARASCRWKSAVRAIAAAAESAAAAGSAIMRYDGGSPECVIMWYLISWQGTVAIAGQMQSKLSVRVFL